MHIGEQTWLQTHARFGLSAPFHADNSGVLALIVIVLFLLLIIAGVYFLIFTSEKKPVMDLLGESVQAWRKDDLGLDSFRVDMREAELGEVFSSFPQAEHDYITGDEVDVNIARMRKLEQSATSAIREYSRGIQSSHRSESAI